MRFSLFFCFITFIINHNAYADKASYYDTYDALLKRHVVRCEEDGTHLSMLDYLSWSQDIRHQTTMNAFATTNIEALNRNEQLAFWINAHNFFTIDLIITHYEQDSIMKLGSPFKSVWKTHKWNINGNKYTLHEIKHTILSSFNEPRIHMAISCASLSCPNLRAEAYHASAIDAQLEAQTIAFMRNSAKGVIIKESTMEISKIFDWHKDDFDGDKGVTQFIIAHLPEAEGKTISGYIDYDWALNGSW